MARFGSCVLALVASLAVGCSAESASTANDTSDIQGGIDALNADYDAVGYLYSQSAQGVRGCTATLIAPTVILTAKHCVMSNPREEGTPTYLDEGGRVYFLLGHDVRRSTGRAEAKAVTLAPGFGGGLTSMASDVAVYTLATPITDVKPIPVADGLPSAADVDTTFISIGYGTQDENGTAGTRKIGAARLSAVAGSAARAAFPNVDAWIASRKEMYAAQWSVQAEQYFRAEWDEKALDEGYEVYVGAVRAQGEVQVCHGDSGGPLLRRDNGQLHVYGVASTTFGQVGQLCRDGGTYATFGPGTREIITNALAAAAVQ